MSHVLQCFIANAILSHLLNQCFAFYSGSLPGSSGSLTVALSPSNTHQDNNAPIATCTMQTFILTTASGKPVCRYGLGGAARSSQPKSLPLKYRDVLATKQNVGAPFYFYYNPHRYPAFLSGIVASFTDENDLDREDVFIASGGSDHSIADIDQRVQDALKYSGGYYLDAFVLEYVCPEELIKPPNDKSEILTPQAVIEQTKLGTELKAAIVRLQSLVAKGKIRYIMASTHSHFVGAVLCKSKTHQSSHPFLDAIMLRYNLSHKRGAESISFPYALENDVPVLAFTTTRWNRLLKHNQLGEGNKTTDPPTAADCIMFALRHPAVEIVLHSARDEEELNDALQPLINRSSVDSLDWLSDEEYISFREYGDDEVKWNVDDEFDEYPEESQ